MQTCSLLLVLLCCQSHLIVFMLYVVFCLLFHFALFHHHHFILFPFALFIVFVIEIVYIVVAFHFNLLHITSIFKHISILKISYIFYVLQSFVKKHFLAMSNYKND